MGRKIYAYEHDDSNTSKDITFHDYDDLAGFDIIDVPIEHQKIWDGKEVVVGGMNDTIGTDWEDISTFDADNNYLTATTVAGLAISSTAAGDCYNTYVGQVSGGARTVRVHYLDVDWNAQTLDVNMSGTKMVPLGTDILRANKIEVVAVGISGEAAGDIVLASSGTKYLKIEQSCNESYNGFYYVPDGKNLVITDASCYPQVSNEVSLEFVYKVQEPRVVGADTNYLEYYKWAGSFISGSSISMAPNMNSPLLVKDRCRVRMRTKADAASGKAIGWIKGYLVNEKG